MGFDTGSNGGDAGAVFFGAGTASFLENIEKIEFEVDAFGTAAGSVTCCWREV